jgi:hypothetical protein
MLIFSIILASFSWAGPTKIFTKSNDTKILNLCSVNQTPAAEIGLHGHGVTPHGTIAISPVCVPNAPGWSVKFNLRYKGTDYADNSSISIAPNRGEIETVELFYESCHSIQGCVYSYGWMNYVTARPVQISTSLDSITCRKSEYGYYQTYFDFSAPDPDGDDPSTVVAYPAIISDPSESASFVTMPDLPNGKQRFAVTQGNAGTVKFKLRAYNKEGQYGLLRESPEYTVTCNHEYELNLEKIEFAQSVFMEGLSTANNVSLIQNKPLMARLEITSNKQAEPEDVNRKIGVEVVARIGSAEHRLVGCINLGGFDSSLKQKIELFRGYGIQPFSLIGTGSADVEINNNVNGILPGKGCGDQFSNGVSRTPIVKSVFYGARARFTSVASPILSLSFWNVRPRCSILGCDFNNFEFDIQPFVQNSADLVKAMFPINPALVEVESNSYSTVQSDGFDRVKFGVVKGFCGGYERGEACYHAWASEVDLLRVKAAGLMADKGRGFTNRKYIGVVPKSGFLSKSYFEALHTRYPEAKKPFVKGVTNFFHRTADVVLIQSDYPLALPHELVHSFGTKFGNGSPDHHPIHQEENALAYGFSFANLNFGQKNGMTSLMTEVPGSNAWIDLITYKNVYDRMWGVPQNKKIDGDELFITGAVNRDGEFFAASVYSGLKPGLTNGDTENLLQIYSYDLSGAILSQVSVPYEYGIIAESDSHAYPIDTSFAPISTGIPYSEDAFRISLAPIGRMQASVKTIFPTVEILRTAVSNIPEVAFIGDHNKVFSQLMAVTDKIEDALRQVDIDLALRYVKNEFQPIAISGVKDSFEKGSILDVGRKELSDSVGEVKSRFEQFVGEYPIYQNDLLKVIMPAEVISGESAFISVSAKRLPENSDFVYVLMAGLDGSPQRVDEKKPGAEWKVKTKLLSGGDHFIEFSLFVEDAKIVKALKKTIEENSKNIIILKKLAEEAVDPSQADEIRKKIEILELKNKDSLRKIAEGRQAVGSVLRVPLIVQ